MIENGPKIISEDQQLPLATNLSPVEKSDQSTLKSREEPMYSLEKIEEIFAPDEDEQWRQRY